MKLTYKPFETKFIHAFGVSGSTRSFTPLVLVQIEYDGIIGYGEAVMPPYLGESQASVLEFLKKVNLEQFSNPFELDDILTYVDGIAAYNAAAKASIDIALPRSCGQDARREMVRHLGIYGIKGPFNFVYHRHRHS